MPMRYCVLVAAAMLAGGCGIFGGDKDPEQEPRELVDFRQTFPVKRLWSAKLGDGSEFLRLALQPAGVGDRVYAASRDGRVSAFDAASGRREWRSDLRVALAAGPGANRNAVVVAGSDGIIVALRPEDGSELWRSQVTGEVLAPPEVSGDSVVVYTIDGMLRVLSRFNGTERWSMQQDPPALTLRGAAAPVVVGRTVITGFDNGRIVAAALQDGAPRWEAVLSPPSGRSDLDRLADIDGRIVAVGQDVYAAGYQGRLAALAAESGQALWSRDISSHAGIAADQDDLFVVTAAGELVALTRESGSERWRNDYLLRREPTAPVIFGDTVVVGDFEGYLHFFSRADGTPVARRRVGKGMISGAPAVIGGRLYVQSETGRLEAYAPPEPPAEK